MAEVVVSTQRPIKASLIVNQKPTQLRGGRDSSDRPARWGRTGAFQGAWGAGGGGSTGRRPGVGCRAPGGSAGRGRRRGPGGAGARAALGLPIRGLGGSPSARLRQLSARARHCKRASRRRRHRPQRDHGSAKNALVPCRTKPTNMLVIAQTTTPPPSWAVRRRRSSFSQRSLRKGVASLNTKRRCKQVKFCCGCINGLGQRSFEVN